MGMIDEGSGGIDDYFAVFGSDGQFSAADCVDDDLSFLIKKQFDLGYAGNYTWCGSWHNGMRKVIQFFLLKGDSSILQWGYNFDFLPEVRSNRIRYFRTDKSVNIQLREFPKAFIDFKDFQPYRIPMHANDREKLRCRMAAVWERTSPSVEEWFLRVNSLSAAIKETEYQTEYGKYYKMLLPEKVYMKAFLLAKAGNADRAKEFLEMSDTYLSAGVENKEKLQKAVRDLKE